MGYQSNYTGEQVEQAIDKVYNDIYNKKTVDDKIDKIEDDLHDSINIIIDTLNNPWIEISND